MRRLTIVCGAVVLGAVLLLLPRRPKPVPLTEQRVGLQAAPDDVFQTLSTFSDGPKVVERTAHHVIAEFPIRLGWYELTTL
jgi:hypothetical protein